MKRSPLVSRGTPKITYAVRGPGRDGLVEGECWSSGEGTHVWENGKWSRLCALKDDGVWDE